MTGRTFQYEVLVDAPADRVWTVLTDFEALAQASPELVAMRAETARRSASVGPRAERAKTVGRRVVLWTEEGGRERSEHPSDEGRVRRSASVGPRAERAKTAVELAAGLSTTLISLKGRAENR